MTASSLELSIQVEQGIQPTQYNPLVFDYVSNEEDFVVVGSINAVVRELKLEAKALNKNMQKKELIDFISTRLTPFEKKQFIPEKVRPFGSMK